MMNLVRLAVQRAGRRGAFFTMSQSQPPPVPRICPKCGPLLLMEVTGTKRPDEPAVYFCGKCGARLQAKGDGTGRPRNSTPIQAAG